MGVPAIQQLLLAVSISLCLLRRRGVIVSGLLLLYPLPSTMSRSLLVGSWRDIGY